VRGRAGGWKAVVCSRAKETINRIPCIVDGFATPSR